MSDEETVATPFKRSDERRQNTIYPERNEDFGIISWRPVTRHTKLRKSAAQTSNRSHLQKKRTMEAYMKMEEDASNKQGMQIYPHRRAQVISASWLRPTQQLLCVIRATLNEGNSMSWGLGHE